MTTISNLLRTSTLILLAIAFATLFAVAPVTGQEESQENTEESQTEESQPAEEEQQEENNSVYTFTAQPGDSYTEIARKVTQIYGIETETNLSGEQIVFVETNLTQLAGSPELNLGQEVSINQSDVSEWVDRAEELSEEELALWTKYAEVVDFNTDGVGEVRE